jgi:hypothetical protein
MDLRIYHSVKNSAVLTESLSSRYRCTNIVRGPRCSRARICAHRARHKLDRHMKSRGTEPSSRDDTQGCACPHSPSSLKNKRRGFVPQGRPQRRCDPPVRQCVVVCGRFHTFRHDAQHAIRVKKRGLSGRHGGRSLLFSEMLRQRWSIGSIRQPWYQYSRCSTARCTRSICSNNPRL